MLPTTMTAISITAPGGPEVLVPEQRPVPQVGPGQVLIEVAYAGVNRHDCGQRTRGVPPPGATDIPGLEVAGTVVAIGAGVTRWKVGDRLCALTNGGGYAQYCVAHEAVTFPVPPGFDLKQAASLPETLMTTWFNVFMLCHLAPREWLLVHGGSSGIGTMAIQLARLQDSPVIVTAGSDAKCEACLALGAQHAVNYRTHDFVAAAKSATAGRGVDVILDMVGGEYARRNVDALAPDGRLVHLSGGTVDFAVPLTAIMVKRAVVTGSQLRPLPLERKAEVARQLLARVWPHLGTHVRTVIDSTIPLESAAQAHARMESSQHIGKILLEVKA